MADTGAVKTDCHNVPGWIWELAKDKVFNMVINPVFAMTPDPGIMQQKTIREDAEKKFIMGEIDEEGWKATVKQWNDADGKLLIESYNKQYQATKKK